MSDSEHNRLNFWLLTQQKIHENIKFADAKAAQIIGINTLLLGALYIVTEKCSDFWRLAALGLAFLLGAGILLAASVIRPRGERNNERKEGVIDAIRIVHFDEPAFLSRAKSIDYDALLSELLVLVYDRAFIDKEKYQHLRWSFWISAVAWIVTFAFVAFNRMATPAAT